MRDADSAVIAALANPNTSRRELIWITAKEFESGDEVSGGFWNDLITKDIDVLDGETLETVTRSYTGAGSLIQIDEIPLLATIEVRRIKVTLSQIDQDVIDMVRGYNLKNAKVEIHRGLYNPATRALVAPAFPRFLGFVDKAPIKTPKRGERGGVTLECVSHTYELTRASADKASHASQLRREAGDKFFQYADTMGETNLFWGEVKGRIGGQV